MLHEGETATALLVKGKREKQGAACATHADGDRARLRRPLDDLLEVRDAVHRLAACFGNDVPGAHAAIKRGSFVDVLDDDSMLRSKLLALLHGQLAEDESKQAFA